MAACSVHWGGSLVAICGNYDMLLEPAPIVEVSWTRSTLSRLGIRDVDMKIMPVPREEGGGVLFYQQSGGVNVRLEWTA